MANQSQWLDVAEAAKHAERCTATIRNHIKKGSLPAVKSRTTDKDGRKVVKLMIRLDDLDKAFPKFDLEAYIRKIESEWVPLSPRQLQVIGQAFRDSRAERLAKEQANGEGGVGRLP